MNALTPLGSITVTAVEAQATVASTIIPAVIVLVLKEKCALIVRQVSVATCVYL